MLRNLYEYDEYIGYKFIPNIQSRVSSHTGGYLIKTNSQGFRSDFNFKNEKSNQKRILVFGDSFTAGDGVSNGQRYTDFISDNSKYEVYNFGLSGTGTDQQYLIYKYYSREVEYDLIILTVLVENIRRVNSKFRFYTNANGKMICYPKPYFKLGNSGLTLKQCPVPNDSFEYSELSESDKKKVDKGGKFFRTRNFINKIGAKNIAQKLFSFQPLPEFNSASSDNWLLLKAIIKKWVAEINKPVFLIPLPTYHYIEDLADASEYQNRFSELQNESNVKILDPLTYFKTFEINERRNFRFERDPHLTKLGHLRLGQFITEALA